jgi:hypothetical protein
MARRLALDHPPASLRRDVARGRIRALWTQHPELTAKQVVASLGFGHLLGSYRAWELLKECRLAAARRSLVHKKAGWRLDSRTADRIRISAICKRHPEYTAKQVHKVLKPEHSRSLRWVRKVTSECRRALGRHSSRCNGWTQQQRRRQSVIIHRAWLTRRRAAQLQSTKER